MSNTGEDGNKIKGAASGQVVGAAVLAAEEAERKRLEAENQARLAAEATYKAQLKELEKLEAEGKELDAEEKELDEQLKALEEAENNVIAEAGRFGDGEKPTAMWQTLNRVKETKNGLKRALVRVAAAVGAVAVLGIGVWHIAKNSEQPVNNSAPKVESMRKTGETETAGAKEEKEESQEGTGQEIESTETANEKEMTRAEKEAELFSKIDYTLEQDDNIGCSNYEVDKKVSETSVGNPVPILEFLGVNPSEATADDYGVAHEFMSLSQKYQSSFIARALNLKGFGGLGQIEAERKIASMTPEEKVKLINNELRYYFGKSTYSDGTAAQLGLDGWFRNHGVVEEANGWRHSVSEDVLLNSDTKILVQTIALDDGGTAKIYVKEDCDNMLAIIVQEQGGTSIVYTVDEEQTVDGSTEQVVPGGGETVIEENTGGGEDVVEEDKGGGETTEETEEGGGDETEETEEGEKEPEGEPEKEPEGEPEKEPEGEPEKEPEGEPEKEPEKEPEGEPEKEPEGEPEKEPEGEPEKEPEGEPEKEPEKEPETKKEWGKEGEDAKAGELVDVSDKVDPAKEVTKEYIETVNKGDQGYVDDNKAAPGSQSENNGVGEDGFAESDILALDANKDGGRLEGGEIQVVNADGVVEMAGENKYINQEAIEAGMEYDATGNEAQANTAVTVPVEWALEETPPLVLNPEMTQEQVANAVDEYIQNTAEAPETTVTITPEAWEDNFADSQEEWLANNGGF